MPSQITGLMSVKNGQKQQMLNVSNAREIPYSQYSTMSEEQKNGVIICPDYPVGGEGGTLISSDKVSYDNGSSPSLTKGGSKGEESNSSTGITSSNIQGAVTELATPTFDEASTRSNINSGDTFKTILGKIKKFFSDLKTVAFSGSYNDLSDKPTIPSAQVNSDWNANSGVAEILNKPSLATVATSGSYNDLSNKPTIPDISGKVNKSGDTVSGVITSSYKSGTWQTSWYNSVISLEDSTGSFGGWICGPTKNGRIAIQTYQSNDDKLYIGYATRGRTENSNERQVCWNGATGKWECDITGNCDGSAGSVAWANVTGKPSLLSDTIPILRYDSDIPEGAANLSDTATAHRISAYRNGFTIPYQMDNTNDGGFLRVRGTSESNCILELGTWDDSGEGETIQFNYYPTTSQVTPSYSVSVPKKNGTLATTDDITNGSCSYANRAGTATYDGSGNIITTKYGCSLSVYSPSTGGNRLGLYNSAGTRISDVNFNFASDGHNHDGTYLKLSGGTLTGNLVFGNGGAGGYLNGSATNGGCNSILIGDDAWLGDVNQGGTVGVKSNNTAYSGFAFYGNDGSHYGNLSANASWIYTNRPFLIEGNNPINFGDSSIGIGKDSNSWLHIKSNNGNIYRATYHDFKNPDSTAWVTISALSFATQSSKRYKENIIPISEEKTLKILDVDVVNFDYKKDSGHGEGDERLDHTGVIAEDVVDIIPEVVSYRDIDGEQKVDSVDYAKFVPYLIKMVQMQQNKIDSMQKEINELMGIINNNEDV